MLPLPILIYQEKDMSIIPQTELIKTLQSLHETSWFNPKIKTAEEGLRHVGLKQSDIDEAEQRMLRFAPLFEHLFPETQATHGIIESELRAIPSMQEVLNHQLGETTPSLTGSLWLKCDSHLPISGSIKARGGIYEVLCHAEKLALTAGLITLSDNYSVLASDKCRDFFSQHTIAVGSTGNLGLSIGIMSRALGFKAVIHMSTDAKQWKKDKLRSLGATVIEHQSDYSTAVKAGRSQAAKDPLCYFIDDENSTSLFLGYAVAARRLNQQLKQHHINIDKDHPLFVYLPCGVGGGPGGVSFGLKTEFGNNVHCIFMEPTHCPSMLLGVYTGLHDEICVQDIGLDNITIADGLACGRPSGFVGKAMQYLIDGYITVSEEHMRQYLQTLYKTEGIFIEPSSATSLHGPLTMLQQTNYLQRMAFSKEQLHNAVHIAWATGGSMVPTEERQTLL